MNRLATYVRPSFTNKRPSTVTFLPRLLGWLLADGFDPVFSSLANVDQS